MKRYMLFGYDQYYPCGGMCDFIDSFDTIDDVLQFLNFSEKRIRVDEMEICDIKENYIIVLSYDWRENKWKLYN